MTASDNVSAPSTPPVKATAPPGREFDIDAFRGFVCLSLVLLHFYSGNLNEHWQRIGGEDLRFAVWNLRFGVESFFILAGFMMAHMLRPSPGESVSLALYLKRRFFRLLIPYWVAVLLAAADHWVIHLIFKRGKTPPDAETIVAQLSLLQEAFVEVQEAAQGLWSMVSLEQFYLIWLVVYAIVRWFIRPPKVTIGYGRAEKVMALLTFAGCAASAAALISHVVSGWEPRWQLPLYALYLTMGMLLYWGVRQRFAVPLFAIAIAIMIATAIATEKSRPIMALICVAIVAPLARGYRLPKLRVLRWLAFFGQRSYSIYLMHGIVGWRVFSFSTFASGRGDWVAFPLLAVALIATLLVSMVFYKYVEMPCRERARTVQFRRAS